MPRAVLPTSDALPVALPLALTCMHGCVGCREQAAGALSGLSVEDEHKHKMLDILARMHAEVRSMP